MSNPDMTDSLDTSESESKLWVPDNSFPAFTPSINTEDHLRAQVLVLAALLGEALPVLKNIEAEGCDEAELLQHTITRGEAAIEAVLLEHATMTKSDAQSMSHAWLETKTC